MLGGDPEEGLTDKLESANVKLDHSVSGRHSNYQPTQPTNQPTKRPLEQCCGDKVGVPY
jgi:hypothetical protein